MREESYEQMSNINIMSTIKPQSNASLNKYVFNRVLKTDMLVNVLNKEFHSLGAEFMKVLSHIGCW